MPGVMAGPCPSVTRNSAPGCVILKRLLASPFRWCVTIPGTPKVLKPPPCVRPFWVAVVVVAVVRRVAVMAAVVVVAVVARRVVGMVVAVVRVAVVALVAEPLLAVAAPSKTSPDPSGVVVNAKSRCGAIRSGFFMAECRAGKLLSQRMQRV